MRVSKDVGSSEEPWSFVGTGDGTDEFYILKAIAERYGGPRTLWFPKSPLGKNTGLSVLDSINTVVARYPKVSAFLFLIDREHIGWELDNFGIKEMIERQLSNGHVKIIETSDNTPNGAFMIKGELGSHKLQIYVTIHGIDLKIEEEISKLIELEKKRTIPPEKTHLKDFFEEMYRKRNVWQGAAKLIMHANKNNLKISFPAMTSILSEMGLQLQSTEPTSRPELRT
ncbi:MAG: hypothetical protein U9N46_03645 [Euryarchaeota archaeon]|nr:MAG: hypothetical protein C5S47_05275 [ANME-2 cluster archaeon]MEA1864280.1 hypothetical protein [Euryarchaeota archaeon]